MKKVLRSTIGTLVVAAFLAIASPTFARGGHGGGHGGNRDWRGLQILLALFRGYDHFLDAGRFRCKGRMSQSGDTAADGYSEGFLLRFFIRHDCSPNIYS